MSFQNSVDCKLFFENLSCKKGCRMQQSSIQLVHYLASVLKPYDKKIGNFSLLPKQGSDKSSLQWPVNSGNQIIESVELENLIDILIVQDFVNCMKLIHSKYYITD